MVMRIVIITQSGRETSRSSERPLVRTLRKSPHQANHGYLTRLLPGLFLPVCTDRIHGGHMCGDMVDTLCPVVRFAHVERS